jgi:predicted metal-dependent hydrolase
MKSLNSSRVLFMPQTSNANRQVPTRRMSFDESLQHIPKHFAVDGDLILSHIAVSLSAVFPDGEDFFVRSVRHYRDQITDPDLKRQVNGFIGQETTHGREHRAFNDRLAELGYPVKRFESFNRKLLAVQDRLLSPASNLAHTAAVEHFTATLAELLLTSPETRVLLGSEAVRDLFLWHALEESEHKAVAFDVYRAVGGPERLRVSTIKVLRFGFIVMMMGQMIASLLTDRDTYRPRKLRASWRRFRRSPILQRSVWDQLCEYDRPDFHPDDHDTTQLVEEWRTKLFGDAGTLNDKLAGAAA